MKDGGGGLGPKISFKFETMARMLVCFCSRKEGVLTSFCGSLDVPDSTRSLWHCTIHCSVYVS